MNDTEALEQIDDILAAHTKCTGCHTCKMLRHNRQAIKDRADLLEGAEDLIQEECDEETKGGWMACRMRDARLHMEGKG